MNNQTDMTNQDTIIIESDKPSELPEKNSLDNNVPQPAKYTFKSESGLFWVLLVFGMFFLSFILTFQVILTPIKVIGTSMQPTINVAVKSETDENHSDIVYFLAQKKYYNNDIVIVSNKNDKYIKSSDSEKVDFLIKRVIAVGGQQIKFIKDNSYPLDTSRLYYKIVVLDQNGNDINLDQSYLDGEMYYNYNEISALSHYSIFNAIFSSLKNNKDYTLKINEGCYFVMGDNRNNSGDSRLFGCVDAEDITGKVTLIVPYGKNMFVSIIKSLFGYNYIQNNYYLKFMTEI